MLSVSEADQFSQGWGVMEPVCFLSWALIGAVVGAGQSLSKLIAALKMLFVQVLDEGARSKTTKPTPYLMALMLRTMTDHAHSATRDLPVSDPTKHFLRAETATLIAHAIN